MVYQPTNLGKKDFPFDTNKKIFIDSSVLFAAAISPHSSARDLMMKSLREELKIVISDLVLAETQRNLTKKAPQALPALQLFLEMLNPEIVSPSKTLVARVAKIVELKDAPIVAGAIISRSEYLVSWDQHHLLAHKGKIEAAFQVKVVTPNELV